MITVSYTHLDVYKRQHNHVVRKLLSASVEGDKLGQIAEDKEEVKEYTVALLMHKPLHAMWQDSGSLH